MLTTHVFFPGTVKRIAGIDFVLGQPDEQTGWWPLLIDGEVAMTATAKTIMLLAGDDELSGPILGYA
jgi:hypothetical protein